MSRATSAPRRVHIVFKTHLDIGFTDLARNVVTRYFDDFLPRALALAREQRESGSAERFRWTVGSWLIHAALEQASPARRRALEEGIAAGDLVWHALPCTTHTELMSADLCRYGLGLARDLDRRFGRRTIAAKMTDVPGHTRALVPLLAEAGVRFLHIGVNSASRPPAVPDQFVWRHDDGSEVIVMYDKGDYGSSHVLPGLDDALVFAHRGDNQGPHGPADVQRVYAELRTRFPAAELRAAALDDFAVALLPHQAELPVVTDEIGDTWIHGVGTDPHKVSEFRARCRRREFDDSLLLVAEHTWGRDFKQWRQEGDRGGFWIEPTYATPAFLARRAQGTYARWEESWQEQRDYLGVRAAALPPPPAGVPTPERRWEAGPDGVELTAAGGLRLNGHCFGPLQYQVFGSAEYERFYAQYNPSPAQTGIWARPDFQKPGLEALLSQGRQWTAAWGEVLRLPTPGALDLLFTLAFPAEAGRDYGCPTEFRLRLTLPAGRSAAELELTWRHKQACRIPEALWFGFQPPTLDSARFRLIKMGQPISPLAVVDGGARSLHAVEALTDGTWRLDTLDAPLVAVGRPRLLDFDNRLPDLAEGCHFNLYNNVWGTNFPMWYDEDARFRWTLAL